eukprot:TRINITY_DN14717_c0_g1_i1.p1 TRINITY_DN14717_c0_g1~~TRINITY_DN14717_c0_g1_i1.p1  ORF type:complete len:737 (+),score=203.08 TRINITY_DN14717_c0_g1_i1:54-2264(+)
MSLKDEAERQKQLTLDAQIAEDAPLMQAVELFMENKYLDAEAMFKARSDRDPNSALAHGAIAFLRAFMSWEDGDMAEARRRLDWAEELAGKLCPGDGIGSAVTGLFKATKVLSNFELRCRCVRAEARLLRSLLYVTEESIMSWLRAAKGMNDGYSDFDHLNRHLRAAVDAGLFGGNSGAPPHAPDAGGLPCRFEESAEDRRKPGDYPHGLFSMYDYHTVGGVQFGIGAINVCISLLPPRILSLLKVLGFMHDRDGGYRNLSTCVDGGGLRSPVAALMLLFFHGTLPSFSSLLAQKAVEGGRAQCIVDALVARYPKSSIFLWQAGRVARLHRNLDEADTLLSRAVETGNRREFSQLVHLSEYELAWTRVFALRFAAAAPLFESLQKESGWSPGFYVYARAACADHEGRGDEARKLYLEALELCGKRKFGGKTLSVEQYVERKVKLFSKRGFRHTLLPMIQLAVLFNSLSQTPPNVLQLIVAQVRRERERVANAGLLPCELAALDLVEACCMKELCLLDVSGQSLADTELLFAGIFARFSKKKWKAQMPEESWVLPYCSFEHGCLRYLMGDTEGAAKLLREADSFTDYNFEMPMNLRLHVTRDLIKGGAGVCGEVDELPAPGVCLLTPVQRRLLESEAGPAVSIADLPVAESEEDLTTARSWELGDGVEMEPQPSNQTVPMRRPSTHSNAAGASVFRNVAPLPRRCRKSDLRAIATLAVLVAIFVTAVLQQAGVIKTE